MEKNPPIYESATGQITCATNPTTWECFISVCICHRSFSVVPPDLNYMGRYPVPLGAPWEARFRFWHFGACIRRDLSGVSGARIRRIYPRKKGGRWFDTCKGQHQSREVADGFQQLTLEGAGSLASPHLGWV